MTGRTMEERATDLEKLAETLAPLPAQIAGLTERMAAVELQNVQLRSEIQVGFSAIRGEMAEMKAELREDIAAQGRDTAERLLELGTELRTEWRTELRMELGEVRTELGTEFRTELGMVRTEFRKELGMVRTEFRTELGMVRTEFRTELGMVRTEFRTELGTAMRTLRDELVERIVSGDQETRRQMRVLHEEVIERLARLGEGR